MFNINFVETACSAYLLFSRIAIIGVGDIFCPIALDTLWYCIIGCSGSIHFFHIFLFKLVDSVYWTLKVNIVYVVNSQKIRTSNADNYMTTLTSPQHLRKNFKRKTTHFIPLHGHGHWTGNRASQMVIISEYLPGALPQNFSITVNCHSGCAS